MNCINKVAKAKGMSKESFINEAQEYGYSKLNIPLGINGTSALGLKAEKKGDDYYAPGLKVMTGESFRDREIGRRSEDAKLKERYNVPDAPFGWWVSEKFDGQRAVWDGEKFISRGATTGEPRVYPYIPRWFVALMPPGIALDGELFMERNSFNATTSILKTKLKPENQRSKKDPTQEQIDLRWSSIKYVVFDIIISDLLYEERKEILKKLVIERCKVWNLISVPVYMKKPKCPLVFTEQYLIKSEQQLMDIYDKLINEGAEGVIVRAPGIPYIPKRTKMMLKMKLVDDAECRIIGYKPGEGKYTSLLGSFHCEDIKSKSQFYLGGMTDTIRTNYLQTHPIGKILTYTFNGITPDGLPRHPRYKGIRND
jgi:DNA ligase-1